MRVLASRVASEERQHGGLPHEELRALGIDARDVLDFSVNCNPYGPAPDVVRAIRSATFDRYPDSSASEARRAIAALVGTSPDRIALGSGAAELLWTVAHVLVTPSSNVVIAEPTFCEFRAASARIGASVHEWRADARAGFRVDLTAIAAWTRRYDADVLYLCAPNTPTGAATPAADIVRFAEENADVAIVLDQSFLSLSDRFADVNEAMPGNVICVRSMTKDHAIPGVRVGYVSASPSLISRVETSRPSWATSSLAQAAAVAACQTQAFVDRSRVRLLADRAALAESLETLGLAPVPSSTGFLIVPVKNAASLRSRLLAAHRILVRDCASFGLADYIRLGARPRAEHDRLITALREECHT